MKLYRDESANGLHLQKLDQAELDKIKNAKGSDGKVLAVGTIYYRVARLPLGLAVGHIGEGGVVWTLAEFAKQRLLGLFSSPRAGIQSAMEPTGARDVGRISSLA